MPDERWSVVVPVKGTSGAKSRLGASAALAEAIALDTVASALAADGVVRVIVVTSDAASAAFEALGAVTVADPGIGLNAACSAGILAAGDGPVAVLLGDVPALAPDELSTALSHAEHFPKAFVPDADDDGTVLLAALRSASLTPQFGEHSSAAHLADGYVELAIPRGSGLRRDVDTPEQLASISPEALGTRTSVELEQTKRLT